MAKTKIPKGWRRLRQNEILREGDKHEDGRGWDFTVRAGRRVDENRFDADMIYIRRLPAKKKPSKKKSLKPSPILFSQEDFEENLTVARKRGHSRTNGDKKKPVAGKLPSGYIS